MNKYTFLCIIMHVAGIGVGYFVGKKVAKRKYEDKFNEELDNIREYYEGAHPEKKPMPDGKVTVEVHSIDEPYEKPNPVHYAGIYESTQAATSNGKKQIKIIKDEEYGSDPTFDQTTLLYYTGNDILTVEAENGEEKAIYFGEVEGMIGDALTKFGFKTSNQKRICVRNYANGCDYSIEKVSGSYDD